MVPSGPLTWVGDRDSQAGLRAVSDVPSPSDAHRGSQSSSPFYAYLLDGEGPFLVACLAVRGLLSYVSFLAEQCPHR